MSFPSFDPNTQAASWLLRFGDALQAKNGRDASGCFLSDGWLRESQIFCWDNRTLYTRKRICQHILERLPGVLFSNFRVDTRQFLAPERGRVGLDQEGVRFGFLFQTDVQWGQGYAQLVRNGKDGEWKALVVYMAASDIKGHEEIGREIGIYGNHTVSWPMVLSQRRRAIETCPQALIIGAGQTGLIVAARFKQMGIPALVIDEQPRLGDTWRNRYDSLTLYTPRIYNRFLYQCYSQTWPLHTPKDKLASWIEYYADTQDLIVWNNSKPTGNALPVYDDMAKRWTITIDRSGQHVTLHPAHIVLCIGTFGSPTEPNVKNRAIFKGPVIHSSVYTSSSPFSGKRVVVIGAGNSAGDICVDLSVAAESITLVQRSKSTLVPVEVVRDGLSYLWPDDGSVPIEIADFKSASTPVNLERIVFKAMKAGGGGVSGKYADLYKGLQEKGMIVDDGEDGEGIRFQALERGGGFLLDTGCSNQILSGRVKVKHGVEVAELKEQSVVFTDGSEVPADAVIFATGYSSIENDVLNIFGRVTAERAGKFGGLDREGELKNVFRPTGQPALWFGAGGFPVLRHGSKQLAMFIKAMDLGLRGR